MYTKVGSKKTSNLWPLKLPANCQQSQQIWPTLICSPWRQPHNIFFAIHYLRVSLTNMYRVYTFPFLCLFFYTQTCNLPHQPLLKNVLGKFFCIVVLNDYYQTPYCVCKTKFVKRGKKRWKNKHNAIKINFKFLHDKFKVKEYTIRNNVFVQAAIFPNSSFAGWTNYLRIS